MALGSISASFCDHFGDLKKKQRPFTENSSYKPRNPYASSKASADHFVNSFSNTYNLDTIITNCSNNFGERQSPEKLIPLVILKCIMKKEIPVYGKGTNIRDWIYVKDHCLGIYQALICGKKNNFCSNTSVSCQ